MHYEHDINYTGLPPKTLASKSKGGIMLSQTCSVSAKLFSVALPCSALDNQNIALMTLSKCQLYSDIMSGI